MREIVYGRSWTCMWWGFDATQSSFMFISESTVDGGSCFGQRMVVGTPFFFGGIGY